MELDLKRGLCRAFCDDILVREVPAGLAVSTAFDGPRGDPLGFYIIGPDAMGLYRVQDDGRTIPFIEDSVADLSSETRRQSLMDLLAEYGIEYDDEAMELVTDPVSADKLPAAAMRFVAMMLRVQDLLLMTQDKVASTFKEDVVSRLQTAAGGAIKIAEGEPVSPQLADYAADLVLRFDDREPVAVFLATYDGKVQEAIILQLLAQHEAGVPCRVVALLESGRSVSSKMRQRADNRLDAAPVFRGDEVGAIAKLQRLATGEWPRIH